MPLHLNPEDEDKDNLLGTSTGIPVDPEPLPIIKQLKSVDQGIKEGRIDGEALLNSETPEALAFETFKKKETGRAIKKGIEAGRIDREKLFKAEPDLSADLILAEVEEKNPGSFVRIIEMQNTLRKVALNTEAEDESGAQMLTEKDSESIKSVERSGSALVSFFRSIRPVSIPFLIARPASFFLKVSKARASGVSEFSKASPSIRPSFIP